MKGKMEGRVHEGTKKGERTLCQHMKEKKRMFESIDGKINMIDK